MTRCSFSADDGVGYYVYTEIYGSAQTLGCFCNSNNKLDNF